MGGPARLWGVGWGVMRVVGCGMCGAWCDNGQTAKRPNGQAGSGMACGMGGFGGGLGVRPWLEGG